MKTNKSIKLLLQKSGVVKYYVRLCQFCLILLSLFLIQCGGGSSGSGSSSSSSSNYFPSNLAIASPTETSSSISSQNILAAVSSYDIETTEIDTILNATNLADCFGTFFGDLTDQGSIASCFGPQVDYVNHPDGSGGSDPLPPGDLGIWTETEGNSTEACAAAQLNSRMETVKNKTTVALKTLASMICTINNTSMLNMPSAGSSLSMTAAMNSMIAAASLSSNPTVNSATLSVASNAAGTADYTYAINITYTLIDPFDSSKTINVDLQTDMTHRPLDSTNSTYEGLFSYYFDNEDNMGNCNHEFGGLNTSTITELGSVAYEKSSSTSLVFDMRYAQSCGSGNTAPLVSNELDPSVKATTGGTPDINGWASNFTILAADFDPADSTGDYAFSWQAGLGDGTARTFNVHLEDSNSDGLLEGTSFFGFGNDIALSNGSILGIYCNWAGPNGGVGNDTSKRLTLAQKQTILENSTSGVFEVVSSNTNYAPTLNCNYDGMGTFSYDSDGNGTIDTVASNSVTNNLIDPSDATNGVSASGFTIPTAPSGL